MEPTLKQTPLADRPVDPFMAYFEAMKADIVEAVLAGLSERLPAMAGLAAGRGEAEESLQVDRYYTAKDLARRWYDDDRKSATNRVHGISEHELPRTRVGPGRGRTLFYGLDILRYEGHVTQVEYDAIQKRKLALLESSPQTPRRVRRLGNALDAHPE